MSEDPVQNLAFKLLRAVGLNPKRFRIHLLSQEEFSQFMSGSFGQHSCVPHKLIPLTQLKILHYISALRDARVRVQILKCPKENAVLIAVKFKQHILLLETNWTLLDLDDLYVRVVQAVLDLLPG